MDSTGKTGIPFAHVFLICGRDTTKLVADVKGFFLYKGLLADTIPFRVSSVGYKTLQANYILKIHSSQVRIVLQYDMIVLDEATIVFKVKTKKDTVFGGFPRTNLMHMIDEQDTLFLGLIPREKRAVVDYFIGTMGHYYKGFSMAL